jgi:hypothetical protein
VFLTAVPVLAVAACGTSHPAATHAAAAAKQSTAAAPASPNVAPTPSAACVYDVQNWLNEQASGAAEGDLNGHNVYAAMNSASDYVKYGPSSGQPFIDTETFWAGVFQSTDDPPSCADSQDEFGSFTSDVEDFAVDTAGTDEANSDADAVLNDYSRLNTEFAQYGWTITTDGAGAVK